MKTITKLLLFVVVLGTVAFCHSNKESKTNTVKQTSHELVADTVCEPDTSNSLQYG